MSLCSKTDTDMELCNRSPLHHIIHPKLVSHLRPFFSSNFAVYLRFIYSSKTHTHNAGSFTVPTAQTSSPRYRRPIHISHQRIRHSNRRAHGSQNSKISIPQRARVTPDRLAPETFRPHDPAGTTRAARSGVCVSGRLCGCASHDESLFFHLKCPAVECGS